MEHALAQNAQAVFIGEMVASRDPEDVLVAYGLGSCVAICLYDRAARVGGMLHALLPTAPQAGTPSGMPAKFVDQGVPALVGALTKMGADPGRLVAHLCGGAQVLSAPGFNGNLSIGERNVQVAEAALRIAGIWVQARAIGGNAASTARLYVGDGQVTVKTLDRGEQVLC